MSNLIKFIIFFFTITETNIYKCDSNLMLGDDINWHYAYTIRQDYKFAGMTFRKCVSRTFFTFPRYSNNPRQDGLLDAAYNHRSSLGYAPA